MDITLDLSRFVDRFQRRILTIDSHTEGETTRLVVGGVGPLVGETMAEKEEDFRSRHDGIRSLITKEPRGSREVLAAVVTEPVTPGAAFGLLYMDARRYLHLCGHATIGAVATLVQAGFLAPGPDFAEVLVDTPSGPVRAEVRRHDQGPPSVAISLVPCFVMDPRRTVEVPGFGAVELDLVCAGGVFAMVEAADLGIEPSIENQQRLTELGMKITEAANKQLEIVHPLYARVDTVDVTEFWETGGEADDAGEARGRGIVVYGEAHVDRSPCGTGTSAKLSLLHHRGQIRVGEPYLNYGPLGTFFRAVIVEETQVGDRPAIIPRIEARAWVTGVHQLVLDGTDPFPAGFML